jgi:hypothetical protein
MIDRRGHDRLRQALCAWAAAVIILAGCSKSSNAPREGRPAAAAAGAVQNASGQNTAGAGEKTMDLKLTSSAFENGQPIPIKYTGDGTDVSPPLKWTGVPADAQELALICDDPDAPTTEPWVHWVIYKISPDTTGLPEGVPQREKLDQPAGAVQGVNSWPSDNVGYRGPKPPSGEHRYYFHLYALDMPVTLPPKVSKEVLMRAMAGRIIAEATLMGTYKHR